jgi:hypothetical protein
MNGISFDIHVDDVCGAPDPSHEDELLHGQFEFVKSPDQSALNNAMSAAGTKPMRVSLRSDILMELFIHDSNSFAAAVIF